MTNPFDEVSQAVEAAKDQLRAADRAAQSMASLLRGRLRQVSNEYILRALKRELQDFNAVTSKWKEWS